MTDREIMVETLAIKLYEHDYGKWPPGAGSSGKVTGWMKLDEDDRQIYRDMIENAGSPMDLRS